MPFAFKAKIYKVGINLVVKVPVRITRQMEPKRGYIPVKGTLDGFRFQQTLVPVKDNPYRLFVNGMMLKGSGTALGDTATFVIEQNFSTRPRRDSILSAEFRKALTGAGVLNDFKNLTPYRQKETLRYLYYLKSDEARLRNMKKVITQLKAGKAARIP